MKKKAIKREDVVKYVGRKWGVRMGDIGVVLKIDEIDGRSILVEWTKPSTSMHGGGGQGKMSHCWWVDMQEIKLLPELDQILAL